MSVHWLLDYRGRKVFTCRVMHSAQLQLSSAEVIDYSGNVVSSAHLIRGDVLPIIGQVRNPEKCCTMDQTVGERAILIRGSKDWGICIEKWEGCVKGVPGKPGVPPVPGVPGKPDEPGT